MSYNIICTSEAHSWSVPTTGIRTSSSFDCRSLPNNDTTLVFNRAWKVVIIIKPVKLD